MQTWTAQTSISDIKFGDRDVRVSENFFLATEPATIFPGPVQPPNLTSYPRVPDCLSVAHMGHLHVGPYFITGVGISSSSMGTSSPAYVQFSNRKLVVLVRAVVAPHSGSCVIGSHYSRKQGPSVSHWRQLSFQNKH